VVRRKDLLIAAEFDPRLIRESSVREDQATPKRKREKVNGDAAV